MNDRRGAGIGSFKDEVSHDKGSEGKRTARGRSACMIPVGGMATSVRLQECGLFNVHEHS